MSAENTTELAYNGDHRSVTVYPTDADGFVHTVSVTRGDVVTVPDAVVDQVFAVPGFDIFDGTGSIADAVTTAEPDPELAEDTEPDPELADNDQEPA